MEIKTRLRIGLFQALAFLFGIMFLSACLLWVVAANLVNTSEMESVTFSSVLGTEEDLRIIYSGWLGLYFSVSLFLLFLVLFEPLDTTHLYKIHASCRIWALNNAYYFFLIFHLAGLLGVLLAPITDPDPEVEEYHYIFASMAFGSALMMSWILFSKRAIYKDKIMTKNNNLLNWLNFSYCLGISILALWFIIESFELDYFQEKGYIELALTIFCVVDRFWQLLDYYHDTLVLGIDGYTTVDDKED